MLKSLSPIQQKVYTYLFIDGHPETEVITMLGYKNGSTKTGYKFVKKIRSQIVIKAKKIVKEMIR